MVVCHTDPELLSVSSPTKRVFSYITDFLFLSVAAPDPSLHSPALVVISVIVATKLSQALPVEPDIPAAPGPGPQTGWLIAALILPLRPPENPTCSFTRHFHKRHSVP